MALRHLSRAATRTPGLRTPAHKLVLLCLADSAEDDTRRAFPGMETLRAWSGLSASQVYRVLADLVEDGLIAQRSRGSRGHRAEFELWPSDPEECG